MNEVIEFDNVKGFVDENGTVWINAEDVARGFGFVQTQAKNGKRYVSIRWERINGYLKEFGFPPQVGKNDFIPENMVYRLGFKASNEAAQKFQVKLADEILPSIRKHGAYMTNETLEQALLNPDTLIQLALNLKAEQEKVKELTPKAKIYDAYMSQEGTVSTTTMAKRYGLTARQLNKMLHDLGIQFKIGSTWYLYDKYSGKGYVKMVSAPIEGSSTLKSYTSMRWTPKGQEFVHNLISEQLTLN